MSEKETGRIKWFNESKGYGFIESSKGQDIFAHSNSIKGEWRPQENQQVTFTVKQGEKGLQAEDVEIVTK